MENKELIDSLKREIELLKELVKSKDDLLKELQSKPTQITINPAPYNPYYPGTIPLYPYIITNANGTAGSNIIGNISSVDLGNFTPYSQTTISPIDGTTITTTTATTKAYI